MPIKTFFRTSQVLKLFSLTTIATVLASVDLCYIFSDLTELEFSLTYFFLHPLAIIFAVFTAGIFYRFVLFLERIVPPYLSVSIPLFILGSFVCAIYFSFFSRYNDATMIWGIPRYLQLIVLLDLLYSSILACILMKGNRMMKLVFGRTYSKVE